MWKRLNSNQMCEQFSYKEVFLINRFLIERFYCIYIYYYNIPYLGCQAEIKKIQPLALYVHYGAHVSHLIASKAVNESIIIRNYLNTVQDLGSLYNQSGKFKQLFQNNENNVIKQLCPTRLLSREPLVSRIINNYSDIINNLGEYCKNGMDSGKSTGILY